MDEITTTARPRPRDLPAPAGQPNAAERTPPHDSASEMALLGSLLLDPESIGGVCSIIETAGAFFSRQNQIIFEGILDLFKASSAVDGVTLTHKLKQKGLYEAAGGLRLSGTTGELRSQCRQRHRLCSDRARQSPAAPTYQRLCANAGILL